jgi:molybdenum-dependent DNA-binding transcriptional regulator ModE
MARPPSVSRMTEDSGVFVQLRLKGGVRMGPGKAELLEHIADSGSISEAGLYAAE